MINDLSQKKLLLSSFNELKKRKFAEEDGNFFQPQDSTKISKQAYNPHFWLTQFLFPDLSGEPFNKNPCKLVMETWNVDELK